MLKIWYFPLISYEIYLQVKWLEDKLNKVTSERDYFRVQWEKLHHVATAAASRTSNSSLGGVGGPNDLHMGGGHTTAGGQLDLSLSGSAAAAAAAAAAHEDYKRDQANGYQNNNDLKLRSVRNCY
jgi:hypothetical protein